MLRSIAIAALALLVPAVTHAQDAMELAKKLTTEGAATFETKSARAMADYYMDDAEVFLVTKDQSSTGLKVDTRRGRSAIESLYAEQFRNGQSIQAKNTVEYARFVAPDILLITGTFEIVRDSQAMQFPFVQVRGKQGEKWLMSSVRLFFAPQG